ncbi:MAG: hypothetical protein IH899_05305, partial [Planctomycetes bacterium]|nr:hypothetical protein [Planctomycetota bacterium]
MPYVKPPGLALKVLGHGAKAIMAAIIAHEIYGHLDEWWWPDDMTFDEWLASEDGMTLGDVGMRSIGTVLNVFIPIDAYLSGEISGFEASRLTLGSTLMFIPGGQSIGAVILAPIMGKALGKFLTHQ